MAKDRANFDALCTLLNGTDAELSGLVGDFDRESWANAMYPEGDPGSGRMDFPPELDPAFDEWMASGMPDGPPSTEAMLTDGLPFDPDELWEMQGIVLKIVQQLEKGGKRVHIQQETQRRLKDIANYPVPLHTMSSSGRGPVRVGLVTTPHVEFVVGAVRALWVVLMGEAELRRCPAPAPRPKSCPHNFSQKCGRWFVHAGGEGRPRKYCSDTCAKRAARRGELARPSDGRDGVH